MQRVRKRERSLNSLARARLWPHAAIIFVGGSIGIKRERIRLVLLCKHGTLRIGRLARVVARKARNITRVAAGFTMRIVCGCACEPVYVARGVFWGKKKGLVV